MHATYVPQVSTLPLTGLVDELRSLEAQGYGVWMGLYAIAQGMDVSRAMGL